MPSHKILIVDSREDYLETCIPKLEEHNFQVFSANSYNEALKKFEEVNPDIVITALMLEHFDTGFVLSYKLKQIKPDLLTYILTCATSATGIKFSVNSEDERKWIKADGFLNEPINIEDMIELIENQFERKKEKASV